jgi:hypothetical protein
LPIAVEVASTGARAESCRPSCRHFYLRARSDDHDHDEENGKINLIAKEPSLGTPTAASRMEYTFTGSGFAQYVQAYCDVDCLIGIYTS